MNVTRDVVSDLLPLYLAGEASADTRALLEEYLRANPEFARDVRERAERTAALFAPPPPPLSPDHEKSTVERVRAFERRRGYLRGLAIALTLMPLSFAFEGSHVRWILWRDDPTQALSFGVAAVLCWAGYYLMGRRLRSRS